MAAVTVAGLAVRVLRASGSANTTRRYGRGRRLRTRIRTKDATMNDPPDTTTPLDDPQRTTMAAVTAAEVAAMEWVRKGQSQLSNHEQRDLAARLAENLPAQRDPTTFLADSRSSRAIASHASPPNCAACRAPNAAASPASSAKKNANSSSSTNYATSGLAHGVSPCRPTGTRRRPSRHRLPPSQRDRFQRRQRPRARPSPLFPRDLAAAFAAA